MKKSYLFLATLLVVAAVSVAVVSCKKENPNTLLNNTSQNVERFTPPQVDDMNAYLKDFKQKMMTSKDDELLSLEEAAWYLSSLANHDFCRINVEYNDFQFDTIDMQINISNGFMQMNDLCNAYEQMCTEIQQFKKGFDRPNQNLYFIKVYISAEGNARIALMTSCTVNSKNLFNHTWYFEDTDDAVCECYNYFSEDSIYQWNVKAATELSQVLNLFEHHEYGHSILDPVYFIPSRSHDFNYTNTNDPYNSGYYYLYESRVYAKRDFHPYDQSSYVLSFLEMCYCLDSYLGLAYDYIGNNYNINGNEFPINWTVTPITKEYGYHTYCDFYHNLHVEYGRSITPFPPTPDY